MLMLRVVSLVPDTKSQKSVPSTCIKASASPWENRARKYRDQDGDDKAWDGNGVPPWVERGSSVAWSEDKSRKALEYGVPFSVRFAWARKRIARRRDGPGTIPPCRPGQKASAAPVLAHCNARRRSPRLLPDILTIEFDTDGTQHKKNWGPN
jgi:hypothetical protein